LHQHQSGELRVIAYACRLFNQAKRAYCTTRQELAAVVFGLKKFKQYLLERRTIVRSDHAALSFLKRTKEPVAQQARWLDFIKQFDLKVEHRAGTSHRAADALSRRPCDDIGLCLQCSKRRIGWEEVLYWWAAIIPSEGHVKVTTRSQARNPSRVSTQSDGVPSPSGGFSRPSDGESRQQKGSSPLGNWVEANGHHTDVSFVPPVVGQEESQVLVWSQEELISSQRSDETLGIVAAWLE